MKQIKIILFLCMVLSSAYAQERVPAEAKIAFTASDLQFSDIKLQVNRVWPERKLTDTLRLSSTGQVLKIRDALPAVYTISTRKPYSNATLIVTKDAIIQVDFKATGLEVKGGTLQTMLQQHQQQLAPIEKKWQELGSQYGNEKDMEKKIVIEKEVKQIAAQVNAAKIDFIRKNSQNVLGAWLADQNTYAFGADALHTLMPLFEKQDWASVSYLKLKAKLAEYEAGLMRGKKAPAFALKSIGGSVVSLEELMKGRQYLLVDVWASWCTPCRVENRKLAPYYAELTKKGIAVVSVSVDEDPEAWKSAVKADKIPWTQLVSDQAMKGKFVEMYKVKSLPSTFLIDKDGVIVQQNASIEDLLKL